MLETPLLGDHEAVTAASRSHLCVFRLVGVSLARTKVFIHTDSRSQSADDLRITE